MTGSPDTPRQGLKDRLAWVAVAAIDELERYVEELIKQYSRPSIRALTSYSYFIQTVNALAS
jgi:hypothetical protein